MRGLRGKVAIVAGAAPGSIGGATAVRLAEEGMAVVAADLNESAARAVVDQIFHAIGYHVPEDFIVHFDPSQLTVAPEARIRNNLGDRVPIQPGDVEQWLRRVPKRADGSIRALASRYVPGTVVGQYMLTGRRSDDPNDIYPHERRRELRGLRAFAAWLNHDDTRSINSIDTYVDDNGRRYIRHYLQDFGSTLGSGSTSAQQPRGGYEYLIEGDKIAKGLVGFGLYERDWMKAKWPKDPSIGNIEAEVFDPAMWKTEYPNPAFNQMDAADAFWAASIVSRFTNTMIQSIVEDARLSNPEASAYLADVIIRRRDKVVRWSTFTSADRRFVVPDSAWGPKDDGGVRYAIASIATLDPAFTHWVTPVDVTIRDRDGLLDVVGIDRIPSGASNAAGLPTGGAK